ncbi:cystatin-B-like, partial [Sphaerodactylus townsendi]|uniref:cystatin-B-like n=1 Tax=Sphaerodactylus townsendi TaxID=933632 RepID=UPI002026AC73
FQVKPQLEARENTTYPVFTATEYRSQVVAGTNYFVKIDVGNGAFVHVRIFRPLPGSDKEVCLTDYQTGKKASDPLNYFG